MSLKAAVEAGFVAAPREGLFVALGAGAARRWFWGEGEWRDRWRLEGGPGEWLRGYPSSALWGRNLRMARVELQRAIHSFVRVSVFSDWAASDGRSLYSTGLGVVLGDGYLRADLAQALKAGTNASGDRIEPQWRLNWRFDAGF